MKMIAKEISKTGLGKTLKKRLGKSRRNRAEVNIGKINKNTKQGETIVVPGKVLAEGALDHAVTVAAMSFSKNAVQKIEKAGGKAVALDAFKSAKNVRVMA
ncbi:MAG: 50S ribosomal protein L18e [Candidatus Diapherotrites archaeon]|nr:50S ribosomal protein L18e [Candidatus Diapherotrites archaeon]